LSGGLPPCASAGTDSVARASGGVELTTLVSFDGTNGTWPEAGLVLGTDGNLYGLTYNGGRYNSGSIFKIAVNRATAKKQP
jgi:uncharacterized repeat protein (TIGR03803 family)